MKKLLLFTFALILLLSGCQSDKKTPQVEITSTIELSDNGIKVDNNEISTDTASAVYSANDIVFYLEGQEFTYGEGTEADEHTKDEADKHTVVHITKPGTYEIKGSLSFGQIAVDLGEEAESDPNAVVTLYLNDADINCDVAPAVIFYNVYECGNKDEQTATQTVDTTNAGANVIIADGSENNINGSYVAKIYKSYELNDEGTEVVDSKKLHKYDGAFYSKMSMNISGESKDDGILNIEAENEGLDSELHLTINSGNINIVSGNDGINTNEDNVSVTTINGGNINITVNGATGEGDGIDSNGWLVINGGSVSAWACGNSGDAGIDSDMGIHLYGGAVFAGGNMLDRIAEENINYVVFTFNERQKGGKLYSLRNDKDKILYSCEPANDFTYLIIANESLNEGDYTFWCGENKLTGLSQQSTMPGGIHGERPENPEDMHEIPSDVFAPPEKPDENHKPDEIQPPPDGQIPQDRPQKPQGEKDISMPENGFGSGRPAEDINITDESSDVFVIKKGGNYFNIV